MRGDTITSFVLLLVMLVFATNKAQTINLEPHMWIVDDDAVADFSSIQDAIIASRSGDKIIVCNGTYYEHLNIDKSILLIGESKLSTIIDGNCTGNVVFVSASNVEITGFTIRNGGMNGLYAGIFLESSISAIIESNFVINNTYGIYLNKSLNNRVVENVLIRNTASSIELCRSSNNVIASNEVKQNCWDGIYLLNSTNNNIFRNKLLSNGHTAIMFLYSSDNRAYENNITESYNGIELGLSTRNLVSRNSILDNQNFGVYIHNSSENRFYLNKIGLNHEGMHFGHSSSNNVHWNSISYNELGLVFSYFSSNNIILKNNITDSSDVGIECLFYSSANVFYHNNIERNAEQAFCYLSENIWDSSYPSGGNYWSDYVGMDSNFDGFGDVPYSIDIDNADSYPLINPYLLVFAMLMVEPKNCTASYLGQTFEMNITVTNLDKEWCMSYVHFKLTYNPTFLHVLNVKDGEFLMHTANQYPVPLEDIYNFHYATLTPQEISVTSYILHPSSPRIYPSGAGTLATVTFNVTAGPPAQCHFELEAELLQIPFETLSMIPLNTEGGHYEFVQIPGDVTLDGKVDIADIARGAAAFGSFPGHAKWNPLADINKDCTVDIMDIAVISGNFGKSAL